MACRNRHHIRQRRRQPAGKAACPGSSDRAVDCSEQATGTRTRQGAGHFEICPGGGIDRHRLTGCGMARGHQRRTIANLRALDIGDKRAQRGQLGAAEVPESIQRRDPVIGAQPIGRRG